MVSKPVWSSKKVFGIYLLFTGMFIVGFGILQWIFAEPLTFSIRYVTDGQTFFATQEEFAGIPHPGGMDRAISLLGLFDKLALIVIIYAGLILFRLGLRTYPLKRLFYQEKGS